MCMITYVPAGVALPVRELRNGSYVNDDGHGWAVANGDKLVTGHSMDFDVALAECVLARESLGIGSAVVFHSRIATHGTVNLYNCHPFPVIAGVSVMAHNGILDREFQPATGDPRSDTRKFIDTYARGRVNGNGIPSRRVAKAMAERIGHGNKLVFLGIGPSVRIVNAWAGDWSGGCWYSNSGYKSWNDRYGYGYGYWRDWRPVARYSDTDGKGTLVKADETAAWFLRPGEIRTGGMVRCSNCASPELDRDNSGYCSACLWCLDCNADWEDCDCFMSEQTMAAILNNHGISR